MLVAVGVFPFGKLLDTLPSTRCLPRSDRFASRGSAASLEPVLVPQSGKVYIESDKSFVKVLLSAAAVRWVTYEHGEILARSVKLSVAVKGARIATSRQKQTSKNLIHTSITTTLRTAEDFVESVSAECRVVGRITAYRRYQRKLTCSTRDLSRVQYYVLSFQFPKRLPRFLYMEVFEAYESNDNEM
jgi:hypothetical protein